MIDICKFSGYSYPDPDVPKEVLFGAYTFAVTAFILDDFLDKNPEYAKLLFNNNNNNMNGNKQIDYFWKKMMGTTVSHFEQHFKDEMKSEIKELINQYRSRALNQYKDELIDKFDQDHYMDIRSKDAGFGFEFKFIAYISGNYLINIFIITLK